MAGGLYVCYWIAVDQPYLMNVGGKPLVSVPYSGEINDLPAMLRSNHSPDEFEWAQKNDVDVILAGHLHGGQVRLPVFGAILSPSRYGVRYALGVFTSGNTVMHVSRGTGSLTPLRYNCPPEVSLLTLCPLPRS